MGGSVGTTKQLPANCQAAGQQLRGSCLAGTVSGSFAAGSRPARQLPGSCQAAARQFRGNCLAGRGVGLIVVGRAVCCAFSALNGN